MKFNHFCHFAQEKNFNKMICGQVRPWWHVAVYWKLYANFWQLNDTERQGEERLGVRKSHKWLTWTVSQKHGHYRLAFCLVFMHQNWSSVPTHTLICYIPWPIAFRFVLGFFTFYKSQQYRYFTGWKGERWRLQKRFVVWPKRKFSEKESEAF